MQYFWQFPERVERLALISSGGLGREVGPLLRIAALPGASAGLWLASNQRTLGAIDSAAAKLDERGNRKAIYLRQIVRALRPLERPGARQAFLQTLRSVIDPGGQHVSARDRLYLLGPVATLVVWGERDGMIPIEHGREAAAEIPHSRFESLPRLGPLPPSRLARRPRRRAARLAREHRRRVTSTRPSGPSWSARAPCEVGTTCAPPSARFGARRSPEVGRAERVAAVAEAPTPGRTGRTGSARCGRGRAR